VILVAGGTGKLGTPVVTGLLASGHAVRVLTRDRARARHLPTSAELAIGDVRAAADVLRAARGCATIVSAVHGFVGPDSPQAIDRDGNLALIRAAVDVGATRFVLVSVHGASADHPMTLHRAKFAAEQALRASGLAHVIVRPTAFMETWLEVMGGTLAANGRALVLGPGTNPINFVSVRDVAALVTRAVCDDRVASPVEIGGPEDLGFVTVAERMIAGTGKPGTIKHVPLPVLRAMSVLARPFAPGFARKARAAVVMNTTDMTFHMTAPAAAPATTTLDDVLRS
jgi:uncharacterized protein YbjT (DUF2867 family)